MWRGLFSCYRVSKYRLPSNKFIGFELPLGSVDVVSQSPGRHIALRKHNADLILFLAAEDICDGFNVSRHTTNGEKGTWLYVLNFDLLEFLA